MEVAAFILSLVGLLAVVANFFLTHFKPAKLNVYIGPEIHIFHSDFPELSTGLHIPLTFTNSGTNMLVISKCAISVCRADQEDYKHIILWREFSKIESTGWTRETHAHAFAITGKSSVTKTPLFTIFPDFYPKLQFSGGEYKLGVHVWVGAGKVPKSFESRFKVLDKQALGLGKFIDERKNTTLKIILDDQLDRNMYLSTPDAEQILSLPLSNRILNS